MMDQEGREPGGGWESDGDSQVQDQVSQGVCTWGPEAEGDEVSVSATAGQGGCWGNAHHRGWEREGGHLPWVDTLLMEAFPVFESSQDDWVNLINPTLQVMKLRLREVV